MGEKERRHERERERERTPDVYTRAFSTLTAAKTENTSPTPWPFSRKKRFEHGFSNCSVAAKCAKNFYDIIFR